MGNKHNQSEANVAQEVLSVETLEDRADLRGKSKLIRTPAGVYHWIAETPHSDFDIVFEISGDSVLVKQYTITRTVGDTEYRQSGADESVSVATLLMRALRHLAIDPSAYRKLGESGETLASVIGSKGGSKSGTSADVPSKAETDVLRAAARIIPGMRLTGAAWHAIACAVAGHVTACQMARAALGTERWTALQRAAIAAEEAASKADSADS